MWTYFLIPYLMLFYFSGDVEGVCQNDETDALCNQRASDGECYFRSVSMGCQCALACQSLSSCPNHPSDGDTDCSCKIAHIVGECGVNKTKCPHTCHLRDVVTCDGLEVVSGAAASRTNPRYLDIVTYNCLPGYDFVNGSSGKRVCTEDGSWFKHVVDGTAPYCKKISCGLSPSFENVTASHDDGVFGDVISYSCNTHYIQVGGSNGSMRCNETGSWDPDLVYGDLPLCEEISCGLSPSFENVTASHGDGVFGDVISYSCNTLYIQVGGSNGSMRCNETGSWDPDLVYGDLPLCEEISTTNYMSASSVPVAHNAASTLTSAATSVASASFTDASFSILTDHWSDSGSIPTSSTPTPYTAIPSEYTLLPPTLSEMVTSTSATVPSLTSTLAVSLSTSYNIDDATVLVVHCFPVNVTRSSDAYTENIPITKKFVPRLKEAKGGKALGSVAIIILVSSMLCVVIVDLMSIKRHCKSFKTNLRAMKIRCREVSNDDVVHFEETKPTGTKAADDSDKVDSVVEIS
ncbi:sushi, von Willebrand factor type A, EGF and pentraxin domain-containing protein 1-like [Haliotis rufescens]|uniref:sushi, von Willebrand factor type A, EGF and pentraxin domain-containing protein 1-like n=1 Tax=Haliotis rufescens TaxID=6454 RepID=UPI00201E7667|nr:sushi, von Willebrand factor type A, EGF and pentraxin domain-containing protein 1-like [Haliotis rufescens]